MPHWGSGLSSDSQLMVGDLDFVGRDVLGVGSVIDSFINLDQDLFEIVGWEHVNNVNRPLDLQQPQAISGKIISISFIWY